MASKNCAGDFRRISRETWQKFKEFYPESGPSITMEFFEIMNNGEDTNIGRHFNILDPPPAPVVTVSKTLKKKAILAAKKAEAEQAAADAAAKIKAELAKTPPSFVYNEDDESKASENMSMSDRGHSLSSSFSTVGGVRNDPRVVSNLPNQPYNPVAEQFAQRAMSQSGGDPFRHSERASLAQSRTAGSFSAGASPLPPAPPMGGSFSGMPPQMAPPRASSSAAPSVVSSPKC